MVDISLLKEYKGVDPCPEDIKQYWETALEEMDAVVPEVELRPAVFKAPGVECFDLFFTGVRGARIHAKYLRPKGEGRYPVLFKYHGYGHYSEDWFKMVPFALSGFCVAQVECRGQGGQSNDVGGNTGRTFFGQIIRGLQDDPQDMLMRHIMLDCAQIIKIVKSFPEVDESRVGTYGGSQGGALALTSATLMHADRTAAVHPFLGDYRTAYRLVDRAAAFTELRDYFRYFDPLHQRENEIFGKLAYIDVKNIVTMLTCETRLFCSCSDIVVPPETQMAIYNNIPGEKKLYAYPDFGHEEMPGIDDTIYQYMCEML